VVAEADVHGHNELGSTRLSEHTSTGHRVGLGAGHDDRERSAQGLGRRHYLPGRAVQHAGTLLGDNEYGARHQMVPVSRRRRTSSRAASPAAPGMTSVCFTRTGTCIETTRRPGPGGAVASTRTISFF